jgi:hypothetical protein
MPTDKPIQNIYITDASEIKEGDWGLDLCEDLGLKYQPFKVDKATLKYANQECKKIILTTDQDLIKDGVQAIDDEFLEWFVKNPSCEFVETERLEDGQYFDYLEDNSVIEGIYENYKIIIPQEEPKQETLKFNNNERVYLKEDNNVSQVVDDNTKDWSLWERLPEQEITLEEAAEIDLTKLCYYDKRNPDFQIKEEYGYDKKEVESTGNFSKKDCACDNCFYGRSKLTEQLIWQQERMYSEEDMMFAYEQGARLALISQSSLALQKGEFPTPKQWFEQFKKK